MSSLLAIRGPLTGMRRDLGDLTIIGRSEGCDIVVPDGVASRQHVRIVRKSLGFLVEDMGSRHGTQVNGQPLEEPRPLRRNDEILVGTSLFLFDSDLDVQNADFTDRSVYLASSQDETLEVPVVASLSPRPDGAATIDSDAADFIVQLGGLFDSTRTSFGDSLTAMTGRLGQMFTADVAILLLWDTAAGGLRPSVVISQEEEVVADASILKRIARDQRALLISDRSENIELPDWEGRPQTGCRSVIAVPLLIEQNVLGALYLERRELDAYSLKHVRLAQAVGRLMSVFIDMRQRAEAQVLRSNFNLVETPIIGSSGPLKRSLDMVARVAPTEAPALIIGETGTGKELLAHEIHRLSRRGAVGPFVPVNCAAIPETLFESQIFGHERGAFTGAIKTARGLVEQANGGTLFLDEIGELPLAMQPKLLRFLQDHMFTRVGGARPIRADVRVIAATNRDLLGEVKAGRFREDLYHRIAVLEIPVPPLRDRLQDIRALAEHFITIHARNMGRDIVGLADDAAITLEKHNWPGNIRELANCLERAVLLCDERVLRAKHLSFSQSLRSRDDTAPITLSALERRHIARVMAYTRGNQVAAAELLGVHRNTLRRKLEEYKLFDDTETSRGSAAQQH